MLSVSAGRAGEVFTNVLDGGDNMEMWCLELIARRSSGCMFQAAFKCFSEHHVGAAPFPTFLSLYSQK